MSNIIYDQVINFISNKTVGYRVIVGNVITDLNLATTDNLYDDDVSSALSIIRRKSILCGSNRLVLVDRSPKYARNHKRPANLYKVVSA
jgi:hypothetical protein